MHYLIGFFIVIALIYGYYTDSQDKKHNRGQYSPEAIAARKKREKLQDERRKELLRLELERQGALEDNIIHFLNTEGTKLPASDIDFRLSLNDIDKTKSTLENLYKSGRVGRTSNYRYFTKTSKDRKTQPVIKTSTKDPEKELVKLKNLLDKGLITKDDYNLKKKQLLGI